jgi:NitT/TauT family transport system substrate-binding protein
MDRRRFLSAAALVGGAMALATCGREAANETTQPTEGRKRLRVAQWGQERYLIYLPFYIAQERGLFAQHGLDVEISFSGNDDQVFAAVARGDAQFGIGDPIFAAISRNRGGDGVMVGQLVDKAALWGVAREGSKPRTVPADFAGARIGTFPRPSTTYTLLREMIDSAQVPGATILEVPIGSEAALLERGAADLVMMLEPAASTAAAAGYDIVTSFPKLWGPFAFTGLTSTASYVQNNAGTVGAMRAAMQDALDLAHRSPEVAIDIAAKLFSTINLGIIETAVRRMLTDETVPKSFAVSWEGWAAAVRIRQTMKELEPGDYADVIV